MAGTTERDVDPGLRARPGWRSWVAAAVPVAGVLAIDPRGLSPFGPVKWLVAVVVLGAAASLRRSAAGVVAAEWAWLVFLAAVGVAAAVGLDPWYAFTGTPERRFGALTWVLAAIAFGVGRRVVVTEGAGAGRRIAAGAAVAIGIAGGWAAAEAFGWEPLRLAGAGSRPVATLGSSAFLGAAAALLTGPALGLAVQCRSRLAAAAAAAGGVALVVSGARAAWVGAVVALVVVTALRPAWLRGRRMKAAVAGGLVVAVALAALSGVAGRATGAFDHDQAGGRSRVDEWRVAARVVAHHPLTGVGPEGYRIAFGAAVDDAYQEAYGRDPLPDRAHDALLDVAVTTGVPGLAAYLALLAVVGWSVLAAVRRGGPGLVGAAAGLLAYGVQSLFLFPLAELEPVAWLLAGVVVALVPFRSMPDPPRPRWSPAPRPLDRPPPSVASSAIAVAGRGLGAVAAVTVLLLTARDVAADRATRAALDAAAGGRYDEARADARRATTLRPDEVRYHLAAARVDEADGTVAGIDAALRELDRARDWSPDDPVARAGEQARLLLERARRSSLPADIARARATLEALAQADPRNAEVVLRLGLARQLDGDPGPAESAWLDAERLAPTSPAASVDLAVAYAQQGRRDEARAAAQRALARDPGNPVATQVLEQLGGT